MERIGVAKHLPRMRIGNAKVFEIEHFDYEQVPFIRRTMVGTRPE